MTASRTTTALSLLVGLLCTAGGAFVFYASVLEIVHGGDFQWFNIVAGILFGLICVPIGIVIAFYEAGVEIDDQARVVRQWHRWRGRPKRVVETPFAQFVWLDLFWTSGARYSPGSTLR